MKERRSSHRMSINIADSVNEDELPDLSSATDLCAKYHVRDWLGRGVSSTVRRCFDKNDLKEYAIKIIDLTSDPAIIVSIQSEINVLKQCSGHPNIIELHDVYQTATFVFLVLEMCKGGELFEYLNNAVKLSEKRARHVMRQLLEAVEYIHAKNIVHRDLKPENILFDESFNVKVSDFGFAVNVKSDTELNDLFGTPSYMAPEVFRQSMYDNAPGYGRPVDIWASGVILYTLLAGSPPFWNRRQHFMIRQIMDGKYSLSSTEWEGVSVDAKDLIKGMLVVDPLKRFTARQCLEHSFFRKKEVTPITENINLKFHARRKFKAGAFVVAAIHRMHVLKIQDSVVSVDQVTNNPYAVRHIRNLIDRGAFRIYGHWVKKGENQNRAALFENDPCRDADESTMWK